ncbi:phosphotransferase [Aquibacillus rhizosphaerae]|uniref:Phosphotransferase n=1 Tax=Aquibacillus rhizosphaerae TaxID=3051431 RepID=A0ABT7LAR6_9BACI|nr:phosphotransferase [Aquibacillus sp. LR5S19]MDL4841645.1 phosphotransferase [Aquibacillus sp. LR5S19]
MDILLIVIKKMKMKVNNKMYRDDSHMSRLSSFLINEGGLEVINIGQIKENVFYIKTVEGSFVLKGKHSCDTIKQQWKIFSEIDNQHVSKFSHFPNSKQFLSGYGLHWTITPFIEGTALSFNSHRDRVDALTTIATFHNNAQGITVNDPIIKDPLYLKWNKRISKLNKTKYLMEQHGFLELYEEIMKLTEKRLSVFEQLDWYQIEKDAVEECKWVHGDVASHNFLRDNKQKIYMIDFDLLSLSPPVYDYIQLGQRFLPYLDWDLDRLLAYNMCGNEQEFRIWLLGITIPSDLIREWWYFNLKSRTERQYKWYLTRLSNDWMKRLRFVEEVESMLR